MIIKKNKIRQYNVLYVEGNLDQTIGGSYYSLYYLIRGLDKTRYKPYVIFYGTHDLIQDFQNICKDVIIFPIPDKYKLGAWIRSKIKYNALHSLLSIPVKFSQKILNGLIFSVYPVFKYYKVLRKLNIDIVHLNNAVWVNHEWILAVKLAGIKCISHQRGIEDSRIPRPSFFYIKLLDAVISVSNAVKTNLEKKGLKCKKSIVIYNALDVKDFVPEKSKEEFCQELGIKDKFPIIGIVGNIRPWKGQEIVLKAVNLLKDDFPNLLCLIIGTASANAKDKIYYDNLKKYIEEENLENNVLFTGYRKDMAACINALDIFVHASIEPEPFGRVILEGMALGKPIIATNIGGVPEIIIDGVTGILVPPNDFEAMANAISCFLEKPKLTKTMGDKAKERLENNFTAKLMAEETARLYETLLCGNK